MKFFRVLLAFVFALLCASCTLIFLIQEDALFKNKIQEQISALFSTSFDCCCSAQIEHINFFTGTMTLKNVCVQDHEHHKWHWKADTVQLTVSFFSLLKDKKISAHIALAHLLIDSTVHDNELAIMAHVKKLINPSGTLLPFEIKTLHIKRGTCSLQHANATTQLDFSGTVTLQRTPESASYYFKVGLNNGISTYQDVTLCKYFAGNIHGNMCLQGKAESCLKISGSTQLATDELCTFEGTWTPVRALIRYQTPRKTFSGSLLIDRAQDLISIALQAPLAHCLQIARVNSHGLEGACSLQATSTCTAMKKNAHIILQCDKVFYKNFALPSILLTLQSAPDGFKGPVHLRYQDTEIAHGNCTVASNKFLTQLMLENTKKIELAQAWYLKPHALTLDAVLQPNGQAHVQYAGNIAHETLGEKKVEGRISASREQIQLQGAAQDCVYDVLFACAPAFHLRHAHCFLAEKEVVKLTAPATNSIAGTISYSVIRFLTQSLGIHIPGEGTLHITTRHEEDRITASMMLENGNIRLPYTYNLLQDVRGNVVFDMRTYMLHLQDLQLKLHKGSLHVSDACMQFGTQGNVLYAHVPLTLNNCFLGMKKDLFALFSGTVIGEFKNKSLDLSGYLLLDRAHIRNNIFSEQFLKNMLGTQFAPPSQEQMAINFALNVMTRSSLRVKTPFLEAAAQAHMHLAGSLTNPEVTGTIEIGSGSFLFPYKPLFIKRGKIYFLPQQMENPVIDILAENNIRKFSVRMAIDGTAKQPNITFDATPMLEEEQIVSLLLGGSEDGSLVLAMPSSVMSSIEKLVFGPAESTSQFQRTLKNLFAPLKNLRITPSFSDKSARGGVRGSLVIDVNDRLRAIIEQNFSLPEDVVIQVEYDISDDARVRAIRDERGDLGGELEASWKF